MNKKLLSGIIIASLALSPALNAGLKEWTAGLSLGSIVPALAYAAYSKNAPLAFLYTIGASAVTIGLLLWADKSCLTVNLDAQNAIHFRDLVNKIDAALNEDKKVELNITFNSTKSKITISKEENSLHFHIAVTTNNEWLSGKHTIQYTVDLKNQKSTIQQFCAQNNLFNPNPKVI